MSPSSERSTRYVTFPYLHREVSRDGRALVLSNPWVKRAIGVARSVTPLLERLTTGHTRAEIERSLHGSPAFLAPLFDAQILVRQDQVARPRKRSRPTRVCLATTVRGSGPELGSFLRYHRAIGIARAFVFFDDPRDPSQAIARRVPGVTTVPVDGAVRRRWRRLRSYPEMGPHRDSEVMARQVLNAELALELARAAGMDWLLHIDDDELLHAPGGVEAFFGRVPDEVGVLSFANHEVAPERMEVADRFKEISLFKKNPVLLDGDQASLVAASGRGGYFNAYSNGKAAVRLGPGAVPFTVHGFRPPPDHPVCVGLVTRPCILHYTNGSFSSYVKKYRLLGRFGDRWFGRQSIAAARMTFHLESRDRTTTGDLAAAERLFRARCLYADAAERRRLLAAGVLFRVRRPRRLLAERGRP